MARRWTFPTEPETMADYSVFHLEEDIQFDGWEPQCGCINPDPPGP